jgi:hypothetical protein
VFGGLTDFGLARLLIMMLTHAFDRPLEGPVMPWGYLGLQVVTFLIETAIAAIRMIVATWRCGDYPLALVVPGRPTPAGTRIQIRAKGLPPNQRGQAVQKTRKVGVPCARFHIHFRYMTGRNDLRSEGAKEPQEGTGWRCRSRGGHILWGQN